MNSKATKRKRKVRKRIWPKVVLLGLLMLSCFVAWVAAGIPGEWVGSWMKSQTEIPVIVEAKTLSFRLGTGFYVKDLKVYSKKDLVTPLFTATDATLDPELWPLLRHKDLIGTLEVKEGRLETNMGVWAQDLKTDQMLVFEGLHALLSFKDKVLTIEESQGTFHHLDLDISGELDLSQFNLPKGDKNEKDSEKRLQDVAKNIAKAVEFLEDFKFEKSPVASVKISYGDDKDSHDPVIELKLTDTGKGSHRGFVFEEIDIQARYENPKLVINEFLIQEDSSHAIKGNLWVNFERKMFEVKADNTLRRIGLEALSPFSLEHLLDWLQLRLEDRCDFQIQLGPNPFSSPGQLLQGHFYAENAFYRDTFFPKIALDLDLQGKEMKLNHIDAVVGQGKGKGPVSGDVEMNFGSHQMLIDIKGNFYPELGISLIGGTAERLIREWEFRGTPPRFSCHVSQKEKGSPLNLKIEAAAVDVLWRGTSFDHLGASVTYENAQLVVKDLKAGRGKESLTGGLEFKPHFKGCDFTVKSTFHLPDIIALIGPSVSKYTQDLRFKGACEISAQGFLDLSPAHLHDFEGSFTFEDIAYHWMEFNALKGTVDVEKQVIELPNMKAAVEGGGVTASFRTRDTFGPDAKFDVILEVNEMDLFKVITKATDMEDTPYKGNLSLNLNLTGNLKDSPENPRSKSYVGKGNILIETGTLFRVPLLMGLSHILSKVVSGFGYASQSDFSADFTVADGWWKSENLFLEGNLLSIAGDGSYRFEGEKISADLKVQLFKDGILSDALKLLLWPIRKLIEVQLTGTIDHPNWQPKNLPKELFGK